MINCIGGESVQITEKPQGEAPTKPVAHHSFNVRILPGVPARHESAPQHSQQFIIGGPAAAHNGTSRRQPAIALFRQISSRVWLPATMTGPSTMPWGPNSTNPPATAMNDGTVCNMSRLPTRMG